MESTNPPETALIPDVPADAGASARAVGAWVNHLARTLKTCRLYDAANPTVARFRAELSDALRRLLEQYGPIQLRFASDDVLHQDHSLYPARSRDDNLALPFHRDGIRALTFRPGIEPAEVDSLLDALLRATGPNTGQDDLVTGFWEANLEHVEMDNVPAESDFQGVDTDSEIELEETEPEHATDGKEFMPWPRSGEPSAIEDSTEPAPAEIEAAVQKPGADDQPAEDPLAGADETPAVADRVPAGTPTGRSDDWSIGELTVETEAAFEELESLAVSERVRFSGEFEAERQISGATTALAIVRAVLSAGATDQDRIELGRFVPRLLRLSVTRGSWLEGCEALAILKECGDTDWSVESFVQELMQPISISATVDFVDQQPPEALGDFLTFARALGEPAIDWLTQVLAESQQRRTRRILAETIAVVCRDRPERLAPWLADRRWYVVRNVVHILGWIGSDAILGLLQTASRHPDARVRLEVVAALGQVSSRAARPLLLRMLEGADTRLFGAALHHLSSERNSQTARKMLEYIEATAFDQRPMEERRAIYTALAATGGDEVVPQLEAELLKAAWFARNQDAHRQAVAHCLARIGTERARLALERGRMSKRAPVRKACEDALAEGEGHE